MIKVLKFIVRLPVAALLSIVGILPLIASLFYIVYDWAYDREEKEGLEMIKFLKEELKRLWSIK